VDILRAAHPGCGVEKMYKTLKPKTMGRDKFCEIFLDMGYRVRQVKNYTRTTVPGSREYPNKIEGMMVIRPYQVIQSDITYFELNSRFYYVVFIIDVYTREILGYNLADNLRAECNVKALRMALKKIPKANFKSLIHHSDRGSQYGSNMYKAILDDAEIEISMGENAQDNAYAERVNGIIKNEYLKLWLIKDFKALKAKLKKAVNHYNRHRLHKAFEDRYSPLGFKEALINLSTQERPMVIIYADGNYKCKVASSHLVFNPREVPQAHNCPIEEYGSLS
jgi:hypothetical protein